MDEEEAEHSIEVLTKNLVLKHTAYSTRYLVTSLFLSSLQDLAFQVYVHGVASNCLQFNEELSLETKTDAANDYGYRLRPRNSMYRIAVNVPLPSERDATLFFPYGGGEEVIKEKALHLTDGVESIADKVSNIFDYCAKIHYDDAPPGYYSVGWNFSSADMIEENLAPNNCKAIAQLFAELCQASSIPTRLVGGIIKLDRSDDVNPDELPPSLFVDGFCGHRWAEYYDGKWVPVDPSLAIKPSEFNPSIYYRKIGEFHCPENISFSFLFPSGLVVPKPILSRPQIPELALLDKL